MAVMQDVDDYDIYYIQQVLARDHVTVFCASLIGPLE